MFSVVAIEFCLKKLFSCEIVFHLNISQLNPINSGKRYCSGAEFLSMVPCLF